MPCLRFNENRVKIHAEASDTANDIPAENRIADK